ncbi:MAG: aldo/keto reductase [Undibacterium sp.]|uniref:aldo/keto reductase n=1 Tax=Undibacterium sp. TaxID=1914977 RepID=UPI002718758B|nr:aldo/keto reductase [Undibacterium sp.]MDO8651859.1 aldo/keto reductase [Undibacterium sp.]
MNLLKQQKLGLGTVQFGLNYGATNESGQLTLQDAIAIIQYAGQNNISVIDTASAYGTSEQVLGTCFKSAPADCFSVFTKTIPLRTEKVDASGLLSIVTGFESSLKNLELESIECLLVHHAEDLLVPGGDQLYKQLEKWREQGRIKKIGVSVYDKEQIDLLLSRYDFQVMQLPINIFDQRLIHNGSLAKLAKKNIEIHARSLLLQGILLLDPQKLPAHLHSLKPKLTELHMLAKNTGITPLCAALSFVKQISEIAVALVGVLSVNDLKECLNAYNNNYKIDISSFSISDIDLIDPRRWPLIQR